MCDVSYPVAGDAGARGRLRPDTALLGALCGSCRPLLASVQPRLGGSYGTVCLLCPSLACAPVSVPHFFQLKETVVRLGPFTVKAPRGAF